MEYSHVVCLVMTLCHVILSAFASQDDVNYASSPRRYDASNYYHRRVAYRPRYASQRIDGYGYRDDEDSYYASGSGSGSGSGDQWVDHNGGVNPPYTNPKTDTDDIYIEKPPQRPKKPSNPSSNLGPNAASLPIATIYTTLATCIVTLATISRAGPWLF